MVAEPSNTDAAALVRAMLDGFEVDRRLRYVRDFIWRGGELQFCAGTSARSDRTPDAGYALIAQWPAAAFEQTQAAHSTSLAPRSRPVVDGRWVRGSAGYELRVGIDLAAPTAIYIRAQAFASLVPIANRSADQVRDRVQAEIAAYVELFLNHHRTVPEATALARRRLDSLGLGD